MCNIFHLVPNEEEIDLKKVYNNPDRTTCLSFLQGRQHHHTISEKKLVTILS